MRHKLAEPPSVPEKYRVFRKEEWPGYLAWHLARWKWARAQPPVTASGFDCYSNPWRYLRTPLGDATDEARERHECFLMDFAA